jgi:hypothetical protein
VYDTNERKVVIQIAERIKTSKHFELEFLVVSMFNGAFLSFRTNGFLSIGYGTEIAGQSSGGFHLQHTTRS